MAIHRSAPSMNNARVLAGLHAHHTHVNRRDGSGGVPGDELDVDVDPGEEIRLLGAEPRPHDAVQRHPDGLAAVAVVEQLRLAPEYVDLVRHANTTTGSHPRRDGGHHRESRQAG